MKKTLFLAAIVTSLSLFASKDPNFSKTFYPMEVASAEYGFRTVSSAVKISVNDSKDSPFTVMSVAYVQADDDIYMELEVYQTEVDGCGSTHYYARNLREIGETRPMGFRYNIHLIDHSTRRCRDLRPYLWEADVRSGFGWCGTGDAHMTLQGNP